MGCFLTDAEVRSLLQAYYSETDHEDLLGRYFTLRVPRDAQPYTHEEAMKLLLLQVSAHTLLLGRRAGVLVDEWVDAARRTTPDLYEEDELLDLYFSRRMGPPRRSHEEALRELGL